MRRRLPTPVLIATLLTFLAGASVLLDIFRPFYQLGVWFVIGWPAVVLLALHGLVFLTAGAGLLARQEWARPLALGAWSYSLILVVTNTVALAWKGTWFNYYEIVIGTDEYILYEGLQVLFWPFFWYALIVLLIGGACIALLTVPAFTERTRRRPARQAGKRRARVGKETKRPRQARKRPVSATSR